jgi:hypothetical protein
MKKTLLFLILSAGAASAQTSFPPAGSGGGVGDPGGDGLVARTAVDTTAARTLTSPAGTLAVTNADGVAGNPGLDIDTSIYGQFSSGAGSAPATCTQGDTYFETDTYLITACPATNHPVALASKEYVDANSGSAFDPGAGWYHYEEFIGGSATALQVGETGMGFAAISTGTLSIPNSVAGHPGLRTLNSHATNDNSGISITPGSAKVVGMGLTGATSWLLDTMVRLGGSGSTSIATSAFFFGLNNTDTADPATASAAIQIVRDTDDTHDAFVFQVCDSASSGCNSAGDDTNSSTVLSTITPTSGNWYRFRIRYAETGVGGAPTIYMRVNAETEKTFCAAGCDDVLTQMPATFTGMAPQLSYLTRNTTGVISSDVDYFYIRATVAR